MREQIYKSIANYGIVPVAVLDSSEQAVDVADALTSGGLPCVEVTFRTSAAEDSIRMISEQRPLVMVGAGTVINVGQAEKAVNAGAQFIVSPGLDEEVVDYCKSKNILCVPGCSTPTEIMQAIKKGIKIIKFFPAVQLGGVSAIKALSSPFSGVVFLPSGGINESNFCEYLKCRSVIACGGSWMIKKEYIQNDEYELIAQLSRRAVSMVREVRG